MSARARWFAPRVPESLWGVNDCERGREDIGTGRVGGDRSRVRAHMGRSKWFVGVGVGNGFVNKTIGTTQRVASDSGIQLMVQLCQ